MTDEEHLATLDRLIQGHEEQLETIALALSDIADRLDATPGGPWLWHRLPASQRRRLATELFTWVRWLHSRYLRHLVSDRYLLPPCWMRHPIAVEELTALMVAHRAAYNSSQDAATAELAYWHEVHLWPCLRRLNEDLELFKRCRTANGHPEDLRQREDHDNTSTFLQWLDTLDSIPTEEPADEQD